MKQLLIILTMFGSVAATAQTPSSPENSEKQRFWDHLYLEGGAEYYWDKVEFYYDPYVAFAYDNLVTDEDEKGVGWFFKANYRNQQLKFGYNYNAAQQLQTMDFGVNMAAKWYKKDKGALYIGPSFKLWLLEQGATTYGFGVDMHWYRFGLSATYLNRSAVGYWNASREQWFSIALGININTKL